MLEITLIKEIFALAAHPRGGFIDPRRSERRVFVCGLLMDPAFVATVIGREAAFAPALVRGFTRGWGEADGGRFHFLSADPGGLVQGVALLGLSEHDIAALEKFERVPEVRRAADVEITIGDIALPGMTYIRNDV